jgi:HTH-type transcriptional regulator/antitoxin HipB
LTCHDVEAQAGDLAVDYPIKTLSQLRPILQGFRKTAGLTQAAMASHLGVTQQTYAQLEANPAAVSVERLVKVLRVLQVDLKLTPTAGGSSASGVAGENAASVPTATPTANRTPAARSAKKASAAATGHAKRKIPSSRKPETPLETQARARSPAQQTASTTTRQARDKPAAKTPRAAARKRENW